MSVLIWVTVGCAVVWIYLTFGHGMFWSTGLRLPAYRPPETWPSVAVVVPARDEAAVLGETLPTLLGQDYPGPAGVVVVDDNSTDGTGDLAARIGERGGLPMMVGTPPEPPPGWAGKMWALRHGVELAGEVDYLLFTDADIAHAPGSLQALVASAGDRDMVSQMARLRTVTRWEKLVIPAFVYFFAQLYPFSRVARPRARTAAAAGGCTLIRMEALERIGGIDAIHGATIDDVALAREVKRTGGRIWLGLAEHVRSVRPYPVLADLWRMIARSAYTQLRHSFVLLVLTLLGLFFVYLLPPLALLLGAVSGDWRVAAESAVAWALMTLTYLPMVRYYRLSPAWALSLPFAAVLYGLMTADSARRHHRGEGASWKGRTYAAEPR